MSRYYYDETYFEEIDSEDKAYWLGFLYADGCIVTDKRKRNSKHVELSLCKKDSNHLQKFLNSLKSNAKVLSKKAKCKGKEYDSCRVNIYNTKICDDLIKLGCTPRKTYSIKFPDENIVPKRFMRDFLRGFFDGDGCINVSHNTIKLSITGMFDMLYGIGKYLLDNDIVVSIPTLDEEHRRNNVYSLWIYGIDNVKCVLDYFYKDSLVYLDRKYNQYYSFYDDYDTNVDYSGIYFNKRICKYVTSIIIDGKRIFKYSKTFDEAFTKRKILEKQKMDLELARLSSNGYVNLRGIKRGSPSL